MCGTRQPRLLSWAFDCDGCGTELKMASATATAMIIVPLLLLIPLVLMKPWIGRAGIVVGGVIGGHLLPWVVFVLFYRVEPTGHFDLSEARGVKKAPSWTRRVTPVQ